MLALALFACKKSDSPTESNQQKSEYIDEADYFTNKDIKITFQYEKVALLSPYMPSSEKYVILGNNKSFHFTEYTQPGSRFNRKYKFVSECTISDSIIRLLDSAMLYHKYPEYTPIMPYCGDTTFIIIGSDLYRISWRANASDSLKSVIYCADWGVLKYLDVDTLMNFLSNTIVPAFDTTKK
jgi:hypothetical protein